MVGKYTPFLKKSTLNCGGQLLNFETGLVMGILNLTSDSFYDGNIYNTEKKIVKKVKQYQTEGADIIDLGAISSRPGSKLLSANEELKKLLPAIELISKECPELIISVDTFRATVVSKCLKAGAHIVNDISAGNFDKKLFHTVLDWNPPYIMMHQHGSFATMHKSYDNTNLMQEMIAYFSAKISYLKKNGLKDIIIDPGLGFSKSLADNYHLLKHLSLLEILEAPILVGLSRKSMIQKVLKTNANDSLNGSTVLHTLALQNGANILRVHDVKEAKEAIQLYNFYSQNR